MSAENAKLTEYGNIDLERFEAVEPSSVEESEVSEVIEMSGETNESISNLLMGNDYEEMEAANDDMEAVNGTNDALDDSEKIIVLADRIKKENPEETPESAHKLAAFEIFDKKLQQGLDLKRKEIAAKSPAHRELLKSADIHNHVLNMRLEDESGDIYKPFADFNARELNDSYKIAGMHAEQKINTADLFRLMSINPDSDHLQKYALTLLAKEHGVDIVDASDEKLKDLVVEMNLRIETASESVKKYISHSKLEKKGVSKYNIATNKYKLWLLDQRYRLGDVSMTDYIKKRKTLLRGLKNNSVMHGFSSVACLFKNSPVYQKWEDDRRIKKEVESETRKAWIVNGIIGAEETARRFTLTTLMGVVKYPGFAALKTLAFFVGKSDKILLGQKFKDDVAHVTQPIRDTYKESKNASKVARESIVKDKKDQKDAQIEAIRVRLSKIKTLRSYSDIKPMKVDKYEAEYLNNLAKNSDEIKKAREGDVISLDDYRKVLIKKAA